MKKHIAVLLAGTLVLLFSCATGPAASGDAPVLLDRAIELTAKELSETFPPGKRLAVMRFDTESAELSGYIMEELTGYLVRGGRVIMVDRRNIEYIQKELALQESGLVSDATALSIGNMLGAETLLMGVMENTGNTYRWRINALGVESSAHEAAVILRVRKDREFTDLLAAVSSGKKTADTGYREQERSRIPQTAADYLNRGLIFAVRGEFDLAQEDFDEAVKLDPHYAYAYLQRGKVRLARQVAGLNIYADFELGFTIGSRAKTLEDEQAIGDFTQAIRNMPDLAVAYLYRGMLYSEITEYDKAIVDYNQALKINPNYAQACINRGNAYKAKKDYDHAIMDYTQALKIAPDYAWAYNNRGIVYSIKGDYDRAIADYTQAVSLAPKDAIAYHNRGIIYNIKGNYDRAIVDYTQTITLDPNYAIAYKNRGIAYNNKGDYDRAIADYTQAITLDPNYAVAYFNRGIAYRYKDDYDRVIADYTQAITLDPNYAEAYNNRGIMYDLKGETDRAIADYTQAISIDPNYAEAYNNRGVIYSFFKKDYDRAIADYTQALKIDPNYADTYNNRGIAYNNKGDYDRAIADYTQAINLNPSNQIYQHNMEIARKAKAGR